jgi:hypothetical protein
VLYHCLYSEHEKGVDERGNEIKEQLCNFRSHTRFVGIPLTHPFRLGEWRSVPRISVSLGGDRQEENTGQVLSVRASQTANDSSYESVRAVSLCITKLIL